jgi:hypothetical protein
MRKFNGIFPWLAVATAALVPSVAKADLVDDITAALTTGATTATTLLGIAIAIPVAFFVFKLGKRALGRA